MITREQLLEERTKAQKVIASAQADLDKINEVLLVFKSLRNNKVEKRIKKLNRQIRNAQRNINKINKQLHKISSSA